MQDALGTPVHPLPRNGIAQKFRTLTDEALSPQAQQHVLAAVAALPQAASLSEWVNALHVAHGDTERA